MLDIVLIYINPYPHNSQEINPDFDFQLLLFLFSFILACSQKTSLFLFAVPLLKIEEKINSILLHT